MAASDTAQQTVSNSVFSYDQAADTEGGAIYADYGPLAITNSTMDHNNAADEGGGVYYDSGDGFSMTNTTLDSNQAGGEGGGIEFATTTTTGSVSLLNDTIARNTSNEGGGIYFNDSPAAYSIENTIVADNSAGWTTDGRNDCYYDSATGNAGAADHGGNLDSDGSCFALPADQVATNPGLDALGNYGGPSAGNPFDASTVGTDLLSAGSPAIGNAVAADCPATDERGVARSTTQGRCDIGALQTAPAALTVGNSAPSSVAAGAAFGDTIVVSNGGPITVVAYDGDRFGAGGRVGVRGECVAGLVLGVGSVGDVCSGCDQQRPERDDQPGGLDEQDGHEYRLGEQRPGLE